ncbi:MAG: hypothetical protein LAQ30_21530 [Acidobacteriia bacterium]|nr:hypothetical protein [Terriglobia bacterium]
MEAHLLGEPVPADVSGEGVFSAYTDRRQKAADGAEKAIRESAQIANRFPVSDSQLRDTLV